MGNHFRFMALLSVAVSLIGCGEDGPPKRTGGAVSGGASVPSSSPDAGSRSQAGGRSQEEELQASLRRTIENSGAKKMTILDIDISKTDSLTSPYKGTVKFRAESESSGTYNTQGTFLYKNGEWVFQNWKRL